MVARPAKSETAIAVYAVSRKPAIRGALGILITAGA